MEWLTWRQLPKRPMPYLVCRSFSMVAALAIFRATLGKRWSSRSRTKLQRGSKHVTLKPLYVAPSLSAPEKKASMIWSLSSASAPSLLLLFLPHPTQTYILGDLSGFISMQEAMVKLSFVLGPVLCAPLDFLLSAFLIIVYGSAHNTRNTWYDNKLHMRLVLLQSSVHLSHLMYGLIFWQQSLYNFTVKKYTEFWFSILDLHCRDQHLCHKVSKFFCA